MQVEITPKKLNTDGIKAPADKSWIIRYIIVSAVKGGDCCIRNINLCDDVLAAMDCAEAYAQGGVAYCGDSATVLRLFLPSFIKKYGRADFICGESLIERPLGPYLKYFDIVREGNTLHVSGELKDEYDFDSKISSQFVSGLLIAGCRVNGKSVSGPYIEMTKKVLAKELPFDVTVPEDATLSAFWHVGNLNIGNVDEQPDMYMPWMLQQYLKNGEQIVSPERLRQKESDRIEGVAKVVSEVLMKSGGRAVIDSRDHRIIMMAAIAAQWAKVPVTILYAEEVSKSYPGFWDDYIKAGGDINVTA